MALKLAGEEIGIQERVEATVYNPGLPDTGDLETGTKTITATAEASGVGNADYSEALTLDKPDDTRLIIKRVCSRLKVTIDSMTAGNLYCRVYVDVQDANHRLFDKDWASSGDRLEVVALTSGTLFDLLSDGAEHTFYFFFWVDSDNAVVSLVELWEAVGQNDASGNSYCMQLDHSGLIQLTGIIRRLGTGSMDVRGSIQPGNDKNVGTVWRFISSASFGIIGAEQPNTLVLVKDYFYLLTQASVATDLVYVDTLIINRRSML